MNLDGALRLKPDPLRWSWRSACWGRGPCQVQGRRCWSWRLPNAHFCNDAWVFPVKKNESHNNGAIAPLRCGSLDSALPGAFLAGKCGRAHLQHPLLTEFTLPFMRINQSQDRTNLRSTSRFARSKRGMATNHRTHFSQHPSASG